MRRWISPRRSEAPPIDTALRFLAQRPRTEYEVRERLRRAGVEEAAIDAAVGQLRQRHLLDDPAFAQQWVEQRQTTRPRGARLVRSELRRHGVDAATAEAAAAVLDDSAEADAYRAAARRARQLGELDERTFRARLAQFLARRGFDWDTIASVVERLWSERSA
jgi:regulatory protein